MTEPEVAPRSLDERYLLVELTDSDDQRELWRGHDDIASRPVLATIYTSATITDEWRDRFDHGAQRLEALSHPGLASTLAHDARAQQPWLVTAAPDGDLVAQIVSDDGGLSTDDALAVVGQTAMAVKAAHGVGIAHGAIDGQHIVVRSDGSSALIGFQVPTTARTADDLTALATLARALIPDPDLTDSTGADVAGFLRWVDSAGATDAGEIGRTALALAAAVRGAHSTSIAGSVVESPDSDTADEDSEPDDPNRPWYDDEERKRVRNGLIAIAVIVVVAGAALLWLISRGGDGSRQPVPNVVGQTLSTAQNELTQDAFRVTENVTDPTGYVTKQYPTAGTVVKVGTQVTLTINETPQ